MLDDDILVKYIHLEIFIFILLFQSRMQCLACQSIETLSFGSNIKIKCNQTYLIFMENNSKGPYWKFADRNDACQQREILESSVNECGVKQIKPNLLRARLKAISHNEFACIYCSIDYKPIAPLIRVMQQNGYYKFELTATGLDLKHESFEIIWAKRVHTEHSHSINYWFYQTCYHSDIDYIEETGNSIGFYVKDTDIERVEFIIRRCRGTCLNKTKCSDGKIGEMSNKNYFREPGSLEKIVCDQACLAGRLSSITTMMTTATTISSSLITKEIIHSSTIQLSHKKQTIKYLISFLFLVFSMVLLLLILVYFIIFQRKNSRSHQRYMKTSNINLDEYKQTNQQSR